MLSDAKDAVAYAIVTATLHPMIVVAVKSVVAERVLRLLANRHPAVALLQKRKAEAILENSFLTLIKNHQKNKQRQGASQTRLSLSLSLSLSLFIPRCFLS